jgi:hypothetical protein
MTPMPYFLPSPEKRAKTAEYNKISELKNSIVGAFEL